MTTTRSLRRTLALFALSTAASLATVTSAKAMVQPPAGYCSDDVIDCRAGWICYNGCGGVNWGMTWNQWF